MLNLLRACLLTVLMALPGPAWPGSMTLLGVGSTAAPAGCTQATTFLARTTGLSGTETTAYTNLICGMVSDGDWAKLDFLYIFATNTRTTALLNLVSTSFNGTENGTVSFSADHGYTGDASTFFINSGFNPTTATSPNYTSTSSSIGVYVLNSRTTTQLWVGMGIASAGNPSNIILPLHVTPGEFGQWSTGSTLNDSTVTNAQGFSVTRRTSATAEDLWKNGALRTSDASATTFVPNASIAVFAQALAAGGVSLVSGDQMAAAFAGSGTINVANVSSRINAYMTALGINVY